MTSRAVSVLARAALPAGVLAAVCATALALDVGRPTTPGGGPVVDLPAAAPVAFFSGCPDLLSYYRDHGRKLVGPYGLPGTAMAYGAMDTMRMSAPEGAPVPAAGMPGSAAAPAATQAGSASTSDTTSATGTNVQVPGVDEADQVKRSGDLLLWLALDRLQVARLDHGRVVPLGSLRWDTWGPTQLLVDGDVVLLTGAVPGPESASLPAPSPGGPVPVAVRALLPRTRLAQVDLSDPAHPRVVRTLDVDGGLVGARLVAGQARIALTTPGFGLPFVAPQTGTSDAERTATARNRDVIARSTVEQWLPGYTLTEYGAGGRPSTARHTGTLLACSSVAAPRTFSGLATLSLLSIDLHGGSGIGSWSGAGLVADGTTVYATAEHTYIATSAWVDWRALEGTALRSELQSTRTQIHLFDTPADGAPRYLGSGQVPGFLLGQFALDEYDGYLRVASTLQPPFRTVQPQVVVPVPETAGKPPPDTVVSSGPQPDLPPEPSRSQVTVLALRGGALVRVGQVDGLGRGETIHAVRFIGPVGYVVTFRQTDPLYTVDLSRPEAPRVAGELKVRGYSAYLHPVGDGLLLGIGQDATASGTSQGLQMSLFDVSDPADPRRLDRVRLPGAYSDVEADHHAFTFSDGLALAPFNRYAAQDYDAGVLAVRVADQRLAAPVTLRPIAAGPVSPTGQDPAPQPVLDATPMRALVLDGFIYTVTPTGIAVHDAATLQRIGFTRI